MIYTNFKAITATQKEIKKTKTHPVDKKKSLKMYKKENWDVIKCGNQ